MISAFIFALHLLFILYVFSLKWQSESIGSGFINLALIVILFTIGWSITSTFAKVLFDQKGFGVHFDRDTISLFSLAIIEYFFYKFYYGEDKTTEVDTEM
ncbi:MAG: hypothetical protein KF816_06155 [Melioribacteraceae bacterium]|jgi:hypothetical protein|nr:hypothetical protein [Melioribacteraceae bacterium]